MSLIRIVEVKEGRLTYLVYIDRRGGEEGEMMSIDSFFRECFLRRSREMG